MTRNVALIILFDNDGSILLQHRTDDAPTFPGYWGFFGGGIRIEESTLGAVKREAFEELNYVMKNPKLVLTFDYKTDTHEGMKYYFTEFCTDKSLLTLKEGQGMIWVTIAQAKNFKIGDWNRNILDRLELKLLI